MDDLWLIYGWSMDGTLIYGSNCFLGSFWILGCFWGVIPSEESTLVQGLWPFMAKTMVHCWKEDERRWHGWRKQKEAHYLKGSLIVGLFRGDRYWKACQCGKPQMESYATPLDILCNSASPDKPLRAIESSIECWVFDIYNQITLGRSNAAMYGNGKL